jgi:hypothetical protein
VTSNDDDTYLTANLDLCSLGSMSCKRLYTYLPIVLIFNVQTVSTFGISFSVSMQDIFS